MSSAITSKLFRPLTVGDVTLKHRVVMAPLTRFRANANHVPLPIVKEMYAQRASTPGTLLITEATFIAPRAIGYDHAPGIWSDEQIAAWKEVTEAVHAKGSFIYLQLWAIGRIAYVNSLAKEDPSYDIVSASDIPLSDRPATDPKPRPFTIPEIKEYIALYAQAASNAVHKAGFDGVEIHGANGYLVDQFLQDVSNKRTDEYGGNIENRTRFALEVVDAVVKAVGPRKTAIRISPWNTFQDMKMADPKPTFAHLVSEIKKAHPALSYIHIVEPRIQGAEVVDVPEEESNDFIREIWTSPGTSADTSTSPNARRLISAGGYTRQTAIETAEKKGDLIAFGRLFIANPDLPYRIQHDVSLTKPDRTTFYVPNSSNPNGYTDYPFTDKAH
ncbi:NADH:flavin oxidoreductase/NADH oxidase [Dendrothele bispora CBS 962.96]|uniref:NADH:flavin oxidoreductase/NADH oxidase n=1 Tax=Dendrothele bispora (strain CBS 962.96) TaxID=1314807 RepID=A0A4S8MBW5_DENBC|nr:NADH:flavin oxidoreductase/NADH oxidase [Dendrothele bispora CBS 962.96]